MTRNAILLASVLGTVLTAPAFAKDYLLATARPDRVYVIDTELMQIDSEITLKNAGPTPGVADVSPDGKRAYMVANRSEDIIGVDLETGDEVLRIHPGTGEERVKLMFGLDLSPDGSTLASYQSPVKLGMSAYEVQPTRIVFYDAKTGEEKARHEAPRQITVIAYSADGSKVYGLGRELTVFDATTGEMIEEKPVQSWSDGGKYIPPDVLDAWSQFEVADMLTTPYYTFRADGDPADPEAYRTGLLTLDLKTGDLEMRDTEPTDAFYFSSVADKERKYLYAVYNNLAKFDLKKAEPMQRAEVPHSYYSINVTNDGSKVIIGGALGDFGFYDAETLEHLGGVTLPDGRNMSLGTPRIFTRTE